MRIFILSPTTFLLRLSTLALLLLVATGCAEKRPEGRGPGGSSLDSATLAPAGTTPRDTAPQMPPSTTPVATHRGVISTTVGEVQIELYGKEAPNAVANFAGLAGQKFYDSLAFHRVALGFCAQAGDPFTRDTNLRERCGSGGETIFGRAFDDELDPNGPARRRGYVTGTLAMANSGPNTNQSQFFIILSTEGARHLAGMNSYTIFGFVTGGMDVVKRIEASGQEGEFPRNPVRIKTVTVTPVQNG